MPPASSLPNSAFSPPLSAFSLQPSALRTPPSEFSLLLLSGPTASGKSSIALELAPRINAEILAADSMQVYRGMDILTAKPAPEDRARVPHHGLDLAGVTEDFTVAQWLDAARAAIDDIRSRGGLPLVVGGTGLYIRALRFGLDPRPPTPPELRAELAAMPPDALVARLRQLDPDAAARIDLRNRRRVERALAVALQRGAQAQTTPTSWRHQPTPSRLIVLRRERDDLRARIDQRVDAMFNAGVLDEFRRLRNSGLVPGTTAWQAIGCNHLETLLTSRCTESIAREKMKISTRQFAKRQETWFRREPGAQWIDVPPDEPPAQTADRILQS